MNFADQTITTLNETSRRLSAGEVDASFAHAQAALARENHSALKTEISMARHGQLLSEIRGKWRERLGLPAAPAQA